ncbi:MAG: permease-like cell division protein FtsX [Candidatus Pacebacteria bacterium]|nr:permease-like cell division protein FtsX [Candidatus Paceibacterota bacterium]
MLWVNIKRVAKAGLTNFWRNGWVSLATILVMVITLSVFGSLIIAKATLTTVLDRLQDKVDITVYFKTGASEEDIISLKNSLADLNEVKDVEYVSCEAALAAFQQRHADNSLIIQSLEEIDGNPLGASLNIKAKNPSQYESIAKFLESGTPAQEGVFSAIDKVNYHQNRLVIDRMANILQTSRNLGSGLSLALAFVALLVTFNTIRLAIYTNSEEIKVMRLVGASNKYIRSPFVVEGTLYGVFASIISMALFYPLTLWLGPMSERFLGDINIFTYYVSNFFEIFAVLLIVGVSLGVVSSWIATRRYLGV